MCFCCIHARLGWMLRNQPTRRINRPGTTDYLRTRTTTATSIRGPARLHACGEIQRRGHVSAHHASSSGSGVSAADLPGNVSRQCAHAGLSAAGDCCPVDFRGNPASKRGELSTVSTAVTAFCRASSGTMYPLPVLSLLKRIKLTI